MQSHNCSAIIQYYLKLPIHFSQLFFEWELKKQVLEGHTNEWRRAWVLCTFFYEKPLSRDLTGSRLSTSSVFMLLFIFRMVDIKVGSPWRPGLWLCLTSVKCHPSSRLIMNHKMIEIVDEAGQMLWPWPKSRQLSHAVPSNNPCSCVSITIKRTSLFST